MFNVYVLKSLKNGKGYVGYTSKSSEIRLNEHNRGTTNWTRQNRPFKLVYEEKHPDKTEAIKRENYLKSGVGRSFLDSVV